MRSDWMQIHFPIYFYTHLLMAEIPHMRKLSVSSYRPGITYPQHIRERERERETHIKNENCLSLSVIVIKMLFFFSFLTCSPFYSNLPTNEIWKLCPARKIPRFHSNIPSKHKSCSKIRSKKQMCTPLG